MTPLDGTPAHDDPARRWRAFSRYTVVILGASMLATVALVAVITAWQLGGLARSEQQRKADELAGLMARVLFVPVSLKDRERMKLIVDGYLEDPDLLRIVVSGAEGETLASRERPLPATRIVEASRPILSPLEERGLAPSARPLGSVSIALSLARKYGIVRRSLLTIVALSGLLLSIAISVDLALIRRMTLRLRFLVEEAQLAEKFELSNRELEQFAFVASHDLQEPLRKIISFCQLLERRYRGRLDADADALLNVIMGGGERMRVLINDLLSYARVGAQHAPLQRTDCGAVLREVLDLLQEPIRESGATLSCGPLPVILADPLQLGQVLQNLIGNALKFRGDRPPKVRLSAALEGEYWRFTVADNGIGIDPQYRERVFEMFKRLNPRDKYPGTGVGLAICRKIVERHGGRIWVDSAPGRETAFHFTLRAGGFP